jgi:hypothetical protein
MMPYLGALCLSPMFEEPIDFVMSYFFPGVFPEVPRCSRTH